MCFDYSSVTQFSIIISQDSALEQVELEEEIQRQRERVQKRQAAEAKERGNASFRLKKYDEAVEFYSTSIQLDPQESVYYLNRAMAFLKLERYRHCVVSWRGLSWIFNDCVQRYREAEQDCTQSLKLSHSNVKALWRRGVARMKLRRFADAKQGARACTDCTI